MPNEQRHLVEEMYRDTLSDFRLASYYALKYDGFTRLAFLDLRKVLQDTLNHLFKELNKF